jgi:hypothetical protein
MTAGDRAKAQVLLSQALDNLLLKWAGFSDKVEAVIPKIWVTMKRDIELVLPPAKDFNEVLKTTPGHLDAIAFKTEQDTAKKRALREEIGKMGFAIAQSAQDMLDFMDAIGLSDEKMSQLVTGIGELGEAVGRIASGDIVGGIIQGIGSIKSVVSGLFGKSEADKKLEEALNKNRTRLEELSRNIGDLNINLTGKQLSGSQDALKEFFASGGALAKGWGDRLGASLLKRGLTMTDLDEVAKTLQIELRPNGHLSPQALSQLQQALGLIEPTQFANDFKGQRDKLGKETSLFNLTPEQQAAKLAALAGGSLGSSAIGGALGGLDFTTGEGRTTGIAAIQKLFTDLPGMSTASLGGLTPTEFLDVLDELKSLLETANQNAEAAGGETGLPGDSTPISASIGTFAGGLGADVPAGTPSTATYLSNLFDVQLDARDSLRTLVRAVSGGAPSTGTTSAGPLTAVGATVTIGEVNIQTAATDAAGISADIAAALNQELARLYRQDQLALGSAART